MSEAPSPYRGMLATVSRHPLLAIQTPPLSHPPIMFPTSPQYHPPTALPISPQCGPPMALPSVAQTYSEAVPQYAPPAPQMHAPVYEGSRSVPPSSYAVLYNYSRPLALQAQASDVAAPKSWASVSRAMHPDVGYALDYQQASSTSQQPHAPP